MIVSHFNPPQLNEFIEQLSQWCRYSVETVMREIETVKIKKAPSRALGEYLPLFCFSSYLTLKTTLILLRDDAPVVVQVDGLAVKLFLQNIQPLQ